jgi:hypothetical protein
MQNSLESPPCATVHHSLEHETRAKRHVEKVIERILHKMHSARLEHPLAHLDKSANNGNPEDNG